MRNVITFLFIVTIGVLNCFSQPGNPGGNGQGGGKNNGNGQCPSCAPIDTDIWILVIGGIAIGGYFYYRNKVNTSVQAFKK